MFRLHSDLRPPQRCPRFRSFFFTATVVFFIAVSCFAQTNSDGQHAFDFDFGTWLTHSSRLLHPLSGSKEWKDMDGVTVVKKVWNGKANIAEYKGAGPAGHVELLALRYYNPDAHQWSIVFATPNVGTLSIPAVGEFENGRGVFYDQEDFNGRSILVRFSIWSTGDGTAQSEQAFSADGGTTWEVNWVNKYQRAKDDETIAWTPADPGDLHAHDFDFNSGTWHTQIRRIADPFSPNANSFELDGTVTNRKIWGGRATLEEIETDGPKGHWEGMTLLLYNPQSQQWSQNFVNSSTGVLSSLKGSFSDGRGQLLQQDTFKGRTILVRGVWADITPDSHTYTESYSADGGATWKPALIARKTPLKEQAGLIPCDDCSGPSTSR